MANASSLVASARTKQPRAPVRRRGRGAPSRQPTARRRLARPSRLARAVERLATYATVSAAMGVAANRQAPQSAVVGGRGRPRAAIHRNKEATRAALAAWRRTLTRWYGHGLAP